MVFALFLGICFISFVVSLIMKNKIAMVASGVVLLITIVIPIGIYSSNIGTIADLEAFYNASSANFEISRDDTASYLSEDKITSNITLIPIYGSIERMGIGQNVANRVLEYRNAVNAYNSSFARVKAYKNNLLYGVAYPDIPREMKLLIINPVRNGSINNYKDEINVPATPASASVDSKTATVPKVLEDGSANVSQKDLQDALNKLNDALKTATR
jgi:hypothetical protein